MLSKLGKQERKGGNGRGFVGNLNSFKTNSSFIGEDTIKNKNKISKHSSLKDVTDDKKVYSILLHTATGQSTSVIENIYNLWLEEKLWDIEICIGKDSIKAHKVNSLN